MLLVAAVTLTAACQARLLIDISVASGGDGQLAVVLGADAALLAEAAAAGVDPLGELAAAGSALEDDGWRVTDTTTAGGGREVRLAVDFADPDAFNEQAATLTEALAAPEVRLVERLALHEDEALLRLDGAVGVQPQAAVAAFGLEPAEVVALVREHDAFAFEVSATLPGELLETTAAGPDMPLRWEVPPGERVEVLAVVERPSSPWWLVALVGAGLVLVLAVLATRRRSRATRPRARP